MSTSASSSLLTAKLPTFEEILEAAKETFRQNFGQEPELACCAPGRVNLIGEHVDYNDGYVLPMALPMVTVIVGGQRPGNEVDLITCCAGADDPKHVKFSLTDLQPSQKPKWANYVKGVIHSFMASVGVQLANGFRAVIVSNVPVGAGLSSSAAIEVATLTFLEHFTGHAVESDAERALICQKAEHKFVGMPCGIMDQMISVAGQKDFALKLDCRSLETFQIPFVAGEKDLVVLICNSDVRHELSDSEYPTRRKQCSEALKLMGLRSYRHATEGNLSDLKKTKCEEVLVKRARHVITEIKRTQDAAEALKNHDFAKMGELMTKSHMSLRDDFQVSCIELDVLVDAAINCSGVLGSRMTGGGFGGCTVTLLQQSAVDNVITTMREDFIKKFNKDAAKNIEFYICTPSQGARKVHL
ncbi:galactokinase [Musca domestica]|uniref:Galactokinase n=2 Tax=Musca domestica TaxID=7370 RepID=A0ABM3UX98_MUSDO|nr:galactokinase [Musca domestica]XP_058978154.1 galactokinase [Musca domestica]